MGIDGTGEHELTGGIDGALAGQILTDGGNFTGADANIGQITFTGRDQFPAADDKLKLGHIKTR